MIFELKFKEYALVSIKNLSKLLRFKFEFINSLINSSVTYFNLIINIKI